MRIREILESKGRAVHSIAPEATLMEVVLRLVQCNVGSLLVCDGDRIAGIITERDILRVSAAKKGPLDQLRVCDYMSKNLVTGTCDQEVADIMGLMTSRRIRHLPILDGGQLVGMISIGDVVKAQHDKLTMENYYLKNYIQSDHPRA